ncbi:unnamed protein product, partial [Symbiodinium necroappetens]
ELLDGRPVAELPAREKQLYEIIGQLQRRNPGTPSVFAPLSDIAERKAHPIRMDSSASLQSRLSTGTETASEPPKGSQVEAAEPTLVEAEAPASAYPSRREVDQADDSDAEDDPEYKKLYARMEAKIRRMCTPSSVSGRLAASPDLVKDWKDKGYKRVQLVKLMIEADGNKAAFQQKVESWRKTEQFRKKVQKVKEYCEKHNFVRKNQYDADELEFWVDFRTEGSRGTNKTDGIIESRTADVTGAEGFISSALSDAPMPELPMAGSDAPGLSRENSQEADTIAKLMDEALGTRKNLDKLVLKMKKDSGQLRDIVSMEECIEKLGTLYDDLAGLQAEVKVNGMSPTLEQQLEEKRKAVKCVLAVSCELKNKSVKRKEPGSLPTEEAQPKKLPKQKIELSLKISVKGITLKANLAQVPAKDIVDRAVASSKDGDVLCPTADKLIHVPKGHEEDGVYKAFLTTGMLVNIPHTSLRIGDGVLEKHPTFRPRDFIAELCELEKFSSVVGLPLESATIQLEDFWTHFCNQYDHPIVGDIKSGAVDPAYLVPLNLHGDGGRTYKKSEIMVLQWQPAIGAGTRMSTRKRKVLPEVNAAEINLKGHSFQTRFLISVLHKRHYSDDPAPLLKLLEAVSEWFGDLYENGFKINGQLWRFLPLGLKGDLVFHAKATGLERSFLRVRKRAPNARSKILAGCCPWCLAGSPGFDFECFDKDARWMQSTGSQNPLPWSTKPTILKAIPHSPNEPEFLKPDVFHILNMGVYKEYAASGLCLLLPFCGGTSMDQNMQLMNQKLRQYLRETKTTLHAQRLTLDLIGAKTPNAYASGSWSKGSDSVVFMKFLLWLVENLPVPHTEKPWKYLRQGAASIGVCMRTLYEESIFMEKSTALQCAEDGYMFLCCYSHLVNHSVHHKRLLFNLVPKLHYWHHVVAELRNSALDDKTSLVFNPTTNCTSMCEDYIGQIARLSRRVSARTVHSRVLRRYQAAVAQHMGLLG